MVTSSVCSVLAAVRQYGRKTAVAASAARTIRQRRTFAMESTPCTRPVRYLQRLIMSITSIHAEPISGDIHPDLAIISSLGEHTCGQYVLVRIADEAGRTGL